MAVSVGLASDCASSGARILLGSSLCVTFAGQHTHGAGLPHPSAPPGSRVTPPIPYVFRAPMSIGRIPGPYRRTTGGPEATSGAPARATGRLPAGRPAARHRTRTHDGGARPTPTAARPPAARRLAAQPPGRLDHR